MAIPSRIIEGIFSKELKAEDYYSIYGKEAIDSALDEIRASNIKILNKYNVEDMHAAVEAKLTGKSHFKTFKIVTYAAAAVFVAAIALPVGLTSMKAKTPQATERTKGPSIISGILALGIVVNGQSFESGSLLSWIAFAVSSLPEPS